MAIRLTTGFSPAARDATCSICSCAQRENRDGTYEGVLDLDVEISYEGNFEICETCAREIGSAVGMTEPGLLDNARAMLAEANRTIDILKKDLATKADAVDVLAQLQADSATEHVRAVAQAYDQGRSDAEVAA